MRRKKVNVEDALSNKDLIETVDITKFNTDVDSNKVVEELKPVSYDDMTKSELITVLKARDAVLESYEIDKKNTAEMHKKEVDELNDYYVKRIKELKALNSYSLRKLKMINDLVNIEKGE